MKNDSSYLTPLKGLRSNTHLITPTLKALRSNTHLITPTVGGEILDITDVLKQSRNKLISSNSVTEVTSTNNDNRFVNIENYYNIIHYYQYIFYNQV
jgi:hypothetical protein